MLPTTFIVWWTIIYQVSNAHFVVACDMCKAIDERQPISRTLLGSTSRPNARP